MKNQKKKKKQVTNPLVPQVERNISSGVPVNETQTPTAAQAGQEANQAAQESQKTGIPNLNTLKQQEADITNQIGQLGKSAPDVTAALDEALNIKSQSAPYDEASRVAQEKLGNKTLTRYMNQGLSFDQAVTALSQDVSGINAEIDYNNTRAQELAQQRQEAIGALQDSLNTQLQALGLQVQAVQSAKQDAYTEMQLVAAGRGGGGGSSSGASEAAIYYADLISKGEITMSQVPSSERDAVAGLMSQYGIGSPEEVGMYPTYNQYLQQQYPNQSIDPNSPTLQKEYQQAAQQAQINKNASILEQYILGTGGAGFSGAASGGNQFGATIPEGEQL